MIILIIILSAIYLCVAYGFAAQDKNTTKLYQIILIMILFPIFLFVLIGRNIYLIMT